MKIYIRAAIIDALDLDPVTQREVASDPNTSPEVLAHMAQSENFPILKLVALNPSTDENTLLMLADMSDDDLCGYIANNRNATPKVISKLIDICNDLDTLRDITNRSNLTADMLTRLAHKAVETRAWQIAVPLVENPNLSESDLLTLLDYDTHARAIMDPIIRHPNVTLEVLRQLLIKDDGYCGYFDDIAARHRLPDDFLWEFARNGNEHYKRDVARIDYTPTEILEYLITHYPQAQGKYVEWDALKNPNLSLDSLRRFFRDPDNRSSIIQNPNCPSDLLSKYVDTCSDWNMQYIAAHPNTPVETLYKIYDTDKAKHTYWGGSLSYLAKNPNLPDDIAAEIAAGTDDRAKASLAGNPNVSPDILGSLVKSKIDIRKALAKNPNTPPKALIKLAKDRSDEVKYIVGENPNLPEEGYLRLLQDPRAYCRWGLEHNPTYKEKYERDRNT